MIQIKFQHSHFFVGSQIDIFHFISHIGSQIMQIHFVSHTVEHIRELRMESKDCGFIEIWSVQIFVFTLLHESRSAHINSIYNSFPGSVLQYGVHQAIRITSSFHVNQIHSGFKVKQSSDFRIRNRCQYLVNVITCRALEAPTHKTFIIYIIEQGGRTVSRVTNHTYTNIRADTVFGGLPANRSIDWHFKSRSRSRY